MVMKMIVNETFVSWFTLWIIRVCRYEAFDKDEWYAIVSYEC